MSNSLEDRLNAAEADFANVSAAITRNATKLPREVDDHFRELSLLGDGVNHWLSVIQARGAARRTLDDLEGKADANDSVPFGTTRILFEHARLIGLQAYLANTWALADLVSGAVGRMLCSREASGDPRKGTQLVPNFINQKGQATKSTAAMLYHSMKHAFGWPIGISYALRNHVIHDGAELAGVNLFEGPSA